jgi:ribosomal protein S12 methylthiotransferase accessory factor
MAELLGLWDQLVDSDVGIVKDVVEFPRLAEEPSFTHYLSEACDTSAFGEVRNFRLCGGAAIDPDRARARALGEAVERYCGATIANHEFVFGSYDELPGSGTPPSSFALFSAAQYADPSFPWRPFNDETRVRWVRGESLVSREPKWVPASMVFVPYRPADGDLETPIVRSISTGLALGMTRASAIIAGLCEVIERDAVSLTWQARLSRERLSIETAPSDICDAVGRFTDVGLEVELVDISTDIPIPSVLAIAIGDDPDSPAVAVASASDPNLGAAAFKSLEELANTRKFARVVQDSLRPIEVDAANNHPQVTDQRHHIAFYCPQSAKPLAAFLWAARAYHDFPEQSSTRFHSEEQELNRLVELVAAGGYDIIVVDVTSADIRSLGLHVVHVFIPGMHPLFIGHRFRALGGDRLYQVPQRLGFQGLLRGDSDNPYPHPLP